MASQVEAVVLHIGPPADAIVFFCLVQQDDVAFLLNEAAKWTRILEAAARLGDISIKWICGPLEFVASLLSKIIT